MKISGPGQIQSKNVQKGGRKKTGDGAAFASELSGTDTTEQTASVASPLSLTPVDALLALQEAPDSTQGRSKGLQRAGDMLDILEEIRRGLLIGTIPMSRLSNLAEVARNQRGKTDDPMLNSILADIELRAEVELAKYGR